jgi:hypothetical protein
MTMAHFAQLDENNKVLQVIVVANEELMENGVESEHKGIAFCKTLLGADTNWVQTSYNATIRKNYAGIDFTYDPIADYFFAPSPYPSWVLNADAQWEAPVAIPTDSLENFYYTWNEDSQEWDLVAIEGA